MTEFEKNLRISLIKKFGDDPLVLKIATAKNPENMLSAIKTFKSLRGEDSYKRITNFISNFGA